MRRAVLRALLYAAALAIAEAQDKSGDQGGNGGGQAGSGSSGGSGPDGDPLDDTMPLNADCKDPVTRDVTCIEGPPGVGCHRNASDLQANAIWVVGNPKNAACDPSRFDIMFDGRNTASYSVRYQAKLPTAGGGNDQYQELFSMYARFAHVREYMPASAGAGYAGSFFHKDGSYGPFNPSACKRPPAFPSEPFGYTCSNVVGYPQCSNFHVNCTVCKAIVRRVSVLALAGGSNASIVSALATSVCPSTFGHPDSVVRPAQCNDVSAYLVPRLTNYINGNSGWFCEENRCCNRTYSNNGDVHWQLESPSGDDDWGYTVGMPDFGDWDRSVFGKMSASHDGSGNLHLAIEDRKGRFGMRAIVPQQKTVIDGFTVHPNAFKVTAWFDASKLTTRTDTGFALFLAFDSSAIRSEDLARLLNSSDSVKVDELRTETSNGVTGGFKWDTTMTVGAQSTPVTVQPSAWAELPIGSSSLADNGRDPRVTYAVFSVPPSSAGGGKNLGVVTWDPLMGVAARPQCSYTATGKCSGGGGGGNNAATAAAPTSALGSALALAIAAAFATRGLADRR